MELKFFNFTIDFYEKGYKATFNAVMLGECRLQKRERREGQTVWVKCNTLEEAERLVCESQEGENRGFAKRAKAIKKRSDHGILQYETTIAWPKSADQEDFKSLVRSDLEADWVEITAILEAHHVEKIPTIESLLEKMNRITYSQSHELQGVSSYYLSNMAYAAKCLEEVQGEISAKECAHITVQPAYFGIIGLLISYLMRGWIDFLFGTERGPVSLMQKRMVRVGIPHDVAAHVPRFLGDFFQFLIVLLAIVAILMILWGIYQAIGGKMMFFQWLRYNGIPIKSSRAFDIIDDCEQEDNPGFCEVSFEMLEPYLKANYEKALKKYNHIAYHVRYTEEAIKQEDLRFLFMMNFLAALGKEEGMLGRIQRSLLVIQIERVSGKFNR